MSPRRAVVSFRVAAWIALLLALTASGCVRPAPPGVPGRAESRVQDFTFATDTFEFPNDVRARTPNSPTLYANYCFVLARAVRQFHRFARFEPASAKLDREGYVERVRQVTARAAWAPPVPFEERVVIPGYPNLRAFSGAEEAAVKAGLGGRFWTWVHWTNWRVTFPVTGGHQARVAEAIAAELGQNQLVQLLVTNWPKAELNHTVVAFAVRETPAGLEFSVWDPNDPSKPNTITFQRDARRFWATDLYDTERGPIRAFRMYYSWFL